MKNEDLQAELDNLIATQAGLMAIVGSLMATHPHFEKFQLHLTGLLEVLLTGDAGKSFPKCLATGLRPSSLSWGKMYHIQ